MAGVRNFTDLLSWQKARDWQKAVWEKTQTEPFKFDQRLVVQINDSTDSVMANIAEGFGRGTQGEFVQFLGYSIASVNETQSHLVVAYDRKYLAKAEYGKLFEAGTEIRKIIVGFITSMVKPGSGVKNLRPIKSWSEHVWEVYERLTGIRGQRFTVRAAERRRWMVGRQTESANRKRRSRSSTSEIREQCRKAAKPLSTEY